MANGMSSLRRARTAAGLSQAELAARAGVSRQLVGAAEAGRHVPRVDAALAISRALHVDVTALFGTGSRPLDWRTGAVPEEGAVVRVGRVRDQLVTAPSRLGQDGWDVADAVIEDGALHRLGALADGPVIGGCEPGLELLERLLREDGIGAVSVSCSNAVALAALTAGRLHAAVIHAPTSAHPVPSVGDVVRYRLASWAVGLAAPAASPRGWWQEALAGRRTVVQREPGAGVQRTFEAARTGAESAPGPQAAGHLEAARMAIATGDPAVTIEPAAIAVGAHFHPLDVHEAQLWVAHDVRDGSAVEAAMQVLLGGRFRSRLSAVGGYDLAACGTRVA